MITFPIGVKPPAALPYAIVGCGPGSFIALCAWLTNIETHRRFRLAGAAPSRKAENIGWFVDNLGVDPALVVTDYKDLILKMIRKYGTRWVLCVTTETPSHAEIVLWALEQGVRYIILDKPMVTTTAESDAITSLAEKKGAIVAVTFNHRYNTGVFTIRQAVSDVLAKEGPGGIAELSAWFYQSWLIDDPGIRQSDWRLSHEWCAILDIWTHAYDLAEFVLGAPGIKVLDSVCGTAGRHGRNVFDNGSAGIEFKNGIRGRIACSQVLPGHVDDIGLLVRFSDPERSALMFSMERGGTDGVFVGDQESEVDDPGSWKLIQRSPSPFIPAGVLGSLSLNPPGHVQGWNDMWQLLFASIAGRIYIDLNEIPADSLPAQMRLPIPLASNAGKTTIYGASAMVASHKSGGGEKLIYSPGDPTGETTIFES